jgi:DDE family transposase
MGSPKARLGRAGTIDSQGVKGADIVGRDSRGYDVGKKINGRKRFIVTDTLGLLIVVVALAASVQDRDGAQDQPALGVPDQPDPVRLRRRRLRRPARRVGPAPSLPPWCTPCANPKASTASPSFHAAGASNAPCAWRTAHRRLARDYERDPATSEAMIRWAAINTMTSRIARGEPATRQQRWHWAGES